MNVLMIDNQDSFTFNIVESLGRLGAKVRVVRNGIEPERALGDALDEQALILLSPGPGRPEDAGCCMDLIRLAREARVPLLGVCLGHQAIGQAFGGRVIRAPYLMHGKTSEICHDSGTIFRGLPYRFKATRYHSLIVEQESLPDSLEVSATTPDRVIMGLRHREYPVEGVQFHPESVMTEHGKTLLENFLKL